MISSNGEICKIANFEHRHMEGVWSATIWASKQAANDPYVCCFMSAHEVLPRIYSNEAICKFTYFDQVGKEVHGLPEFGPQTSVKCHSKQTPIGQNE